MGRESIMPQKMRKSPIFVTKFRSASLKNGFWNYIEANIWDSTVVVCDLCTHTHSHNFAPIGTHLHALTLSHTRTYTHSHLHTLAPTPTFAHTLRISASKRPWKRKEETFLEEKEREAKRACVCVLQLECEHVQVCVCESELVCVRLAACVSVFVRQKEREWEGAAQQSLSPGAMPDMRTENEDEKV